MSSGEQPYLLSTEALASAWTFSPALQIGSRMNSVEFHLPSTNWEKNIAGRNFMSKFGKKKEMSLVFWMILMNFQDDIHKMRVPLRIDSSPKRICWIEVYTICMAMSAFQGLDDAWCKNAVWSDVLFQLRGKFKLFKQQTSHHHWES